MMRIAICSLIIPDYKLHLYKSLCRNEAFEIKVYHGNQGYRQLPKSIGRRKLACEVYVRNSYLIFRSRPVIAFQWLGFRVFRFKPNIIVLLDNVKILSNYIILIYAWFTGSKVIWYTHGKNNQAVRSLISNLIEKFRQYYLSKSTAIIVYSEASKKYLINNNIDAARIFISHNTMDFDYLQKLKTESESVYSEQLEKMLELIAHRKVILFIGRLLKGKYINYFIDLVTHLDEEKFVGLIVGSGPEEQNIRNSINTFEINNIEMVGAKSIEETSLFLNHTDLMFLPGMVGLAISHSFIFGVPIATLDVKNHGPEITYLKHNFNGLLCPINKYLSMIIELLNDDVRLNQMKRNALNFANENFSNAKQLSGFIDAFKYCEKN